MALHIKDNKIMTEKEAFDSSIAKVFAYIITAGIAIFFIIWLLIRIVLFTSLFVFSPGVLIMSIMTNFLELSTGQLWGSSIVISSIILGVLYYLIKKEGLLAYLGAAVICSIILFASYKASSHDSPNFVEKSITLMVWDVLEPNSSEDESSSKTEAEESSDVYNE